MTHHEVQRYSITASSTHTPTQEPQPYLRWQDLANAYYATHVIFVDPKSSAEHGDELLAMMDSSLRAPPPPGSRPRPTA